ncbi:YscO family type III secretion system apparatus protein [Bordetella sp. LUAb4]|uniref:type III secretion system stalk subunit SctO n=1 Tax=Bordetella sp. LUAb4 TaxID=2843195 RepID=UPI001E368D60|nr:YscO family type III secretion system apparatus protein [Bordetella sp. LUAb4]
MTLLKRLLTLREAREKRDAQSVRHARHARAQADDDVATAQRVLEQGLLDARREGDELFDGMAGQLWSLSAVQGMHGKLESLRQDTEVLRGGVVDAEEQREAKQEQLEATQVVHRRSQKQVGKTKEMHTVHEREMAALREYKEDLEMEEIGSLRRAVI